MIILQQVYAFLRHSLQMKYLKKKKTKKKKLTAHPLIFLQR